MNSEINDFDEEKLYDLADLFKIFGDTTRIKILYQVGAVGVPEVAQHVIADHGPQDVEVAGGGDRVDVVEQALDVGVGVALVLESLGVRGHALLNLLVGPGEVFPPWRNELSWK